MADNRAARALFGERLDLATQYAELLVTDGVVRGLIGPREAPRIWDRHLLNCAAVAELIQPGARVVDVGSGAGLPGLALAIARPDLSVVLLEPLARRTSFLTEVVGTLGLEGNVVVLRSRAEEAVGRLPEGPADVAAARAVAPLARLAGWCLPLCRVSGRLLAIKGASASAEAAEHAAAVGRLGGGPPTLRACGVDLLDPATTVVEVVGSAPPPGRRGATARVGRPLRTLPRMAPGRAGADLGAKLDVFFDLSGVSTATGRWTPVASFARRP